MKNTDKAGTDLGNAPSAKSLGLRKKVAWVWADALEHARADGRCGREWVCACGACNIIRKEIARLDDNACAGARGQLSSKADSMRSAIFNVTATY